MKSLSLLHEDASKAQVSAIALDIDNNFQINLSYKDGFAHVNGLVYPIFKLVSFDFLQDSRRLSLISSSGDIATLDIDQNGELEDEGAIEAGILAAAWSPDQSLLVLVTADNKHILMTSDYDVLTETDLDTSDFGENAPINVGWGSKQTQFHGSLGKVAAAATPVAPSPCPDDDGAPRISWRADGTMYAISVRGPTHRTIRIYSRTGVLQSTSEPTPGLGHPLAWRPSGALIASVHRPRPGKHEVVFFERNGLKKGEFSLRDDELVVRDLYWNADSTVLASWVSYKDGKESIQLWTTGNYHWYLKQEIFSPNDEAFTVVRWHPEEALTLILSTKNSVITQKYMWETYTARDGSGGVAVTDGESILYTPFADANVPPPMAACTLPLTKPTPSHVALTAGSLATLTARGHVEVWDVSARSSKQLWSVEISGNWRQIAWNSNYFILGSRDGQDVVATLNANGLIKEQTMPGSSGRLLYDYHDSEKSQEASNVIWQSSDGKIHVVSIGLVSPAVAAFPEFCPNAERIHLRSSPTPILTGLTSSGMFYAVGQLHSSKPASSFALTLATNAGSFFLASNFVIYSTTAVPCDSIFISLDEIATTMSIHLESPDLDWQAIQKAFEERKNAWERRRIERGSRIVTAIPSTMALVLQMPRGNLETVYPRPLVMAAVRKDLQERNYRKAFLSCRRHRIDLSVIIHHDVEAFLNNLPQFVAQVDDVEHFNLLLTNIGQSSEPPEAINKICKSLRKALMESGSRFTRSVLTSYVVTKPPDLESALSILRTDPSLVEYVIFLVDAERLYEAALGIYDFELVLLVAQHAQKDPREYLPFLRELRALDEHYQHFKIDDYLHRYSKALRNLRLAGPEHFSEALAYIEHHQLYKDALKIWEDSDKYLDVLASYGEWLFERRDFKQAGYVFIEAKRCPQAIIALEKALEWRTVFDIAMRENTSSEDIVNMAYRISEELASKKRYAESSDVLLDYAKDSRSAVISLVQGNLFSEARRISTLHAMPELVEEIIHPGALEARSQISEDITEIREQLRKQVHRLRELRVKKAEEPDTFYGLDDPNLHNVDVMTDVSIPATAFTRYTAAPSAVSRTSKKSSKTKRKMERKVGSGRKGTVDEEEYLLRSLTKLVGRFNTTRDEISEFLPHLFQFSAEHRVEGAALQAEFHELESEMRDGIEEVWKTPGEDGQGEADGWATRMAAVERARAINPLDKISKPDLGAPSSWKMRLYED